MWCFAAKYCIFVHGLWSKNVSTLLNCMRSDWVVFYGRYHRLTMVEAIGVCCALRSNSAFWHALWPYWGNTENSWPNHIIIHNFFWSSSGNMIRLSGCGLTCNRGQLWNSVSWRSVSGHQLLRKGRACLCVQVSRRLLTPACAMVSNKCVTCWASGSTPCLFFDLLS